MKPEECLTPKVRSLYLQCPASITVANSRNYALDNALCETADYSITKKFIVVELADSSIRFQKPVWIFRHKKWYVLIKIEARFPVKNC